MHKKKKLLIILIVLVLIILEMDLFMIRAISPREIDDFTPGIPCEKEYLDKVDTVWVIPNYNGIKLSDNQTWCNELKASGKKVGLHGHYHTYDEFNINISKENDIVKAIEIFEACLGYKPTMFKAPQLHISSENKEIINNYNMTLKGKLNSAFHKVYHCNDSGVLSNSFIDAF